MVLAYRISKAQSNPPSAHKNGSALPPVRRKRAAHWDSDCDLRCSFYLNLAVGECQNCAAIHGNGEYLGWGFAPVEIFVLWLHAGSESAFVNLGLWRSPKSASWGSACFVSLRWCTLEYKHATANAAPKSQGKILHIWIEFVGMWSVGSLLHWRQWMSMASHEIDPAWRHTFFESN